MQFKKPDDNQTKQDYKPSLTSITEETGRKKIIFMGVVAGALGAIGAAYIIFNHAPKNIVALDKIEAEFQTTKDHFSTDKQPGPLVSQEPVALATPLLKTISETEKVDEINSSKLASQNTTKLIAQNSTKLAEDTHQYQTLKKVKSSRPSLVDPKIQNYSYNAMEAGPIIKTTPGVSVEISQSSNFKNLYLKGITDSDGEYRISNPPPGKIFWRLEGKTAVHAIHIQEPQSVEIKLDIPDKLNLGDSLSWSSQSHVSYYKIEFSPTSNFSNSTRIFTTKLNKMNTSLVGSGNWYVRVGAFNLEKGSFEYAQIAPLTISTSENSSPKKAN